MKIFIKTIIAFTCISTFTIKSFSSQPTINTILFDQYFSPYSGAANIMTIENVLVETEDLLRFPDGVSEAFSKNSTQKCWGRGLEQFFIWTPINLAATVFQHEVFGHGYRLRQLGNPPLGYDFEDVFLGGGGTSFEIPDTFTLSDYMAVVVAGIEAEDVLARNCKMAWIRTGKIPGRLALTYTNAQQSVFWYTLLTKDQIEWEGEVNTGNDVGMYSYLLNKLYGPHTSVDKLSKLTLLNFLDPMTFYGYYSFWYYILTGKDWEIPMIPFGKGVRYLPNVKVSYAPYGPEVYFENFFTINHHPLYFYMKRGKGSLGAGFYYDHLFNGDRYKLGLTVDVWRQCQFMFPELYNGSSLVFNEYQYYGSYIFDTLSDDERWYYNRNELPWNWGWSASLLGALRLSPGIFLYAEIGGKSAGFLPGYSLDRALVARIGIQLYRGQSKTVVNHTEDIDK